MAKAKLPCPTLLRLLLRYEPDTGKLFWRERPVWMFKEGAGRYTAAKAAKTWNTRFAGKEAFTAATTGGYHVGAVNGVLMKAHRAAWAIHYGCWPVNDIDHEDGDPANNRIANMRDVPRGENTRNRRLDPRNESGAHGVTRCSKNPDMWMVLITGRGKQEFVGRFRSLESAVAARRKAEERLGCFHRNHGKRPAHGA